MLYFAFMSSTLLYLIVGFILYRSGWEPILTNGPLHGVLAILFVALSTFLIVLARRLKLKAFSEERLTQIGGQDFSKYAVARTVPLFALSEIPAILGLVYFFLTGNLMILVALCVLSLIAFMLSKPSSETLDRIQSFLGR